MFGFEILELIAIGALALATLMLIWNITLELRFRSLLKGADGKNLESHIRTIAKDYEEFSVFKAALETRLGEIDTRIKGSVRGIGMIRFNPFAGSGASKPSFAAAFISENGNGLIISSLHARDSVSIFTKNITNFASENELTAEESEALEKARKSLHSTTG